MTGSGSRIDDAPLLRVHVVGPPSNVWIKLVGEVDITNHDQLRAALFSPGLHDSRRICLDLRKLTFCDVAGCGLLLLFNTEARMYGHHVRFLGPRPGVRKVLDLLSEGEGPTFA